MDSLNGNNSDNFLFKKKSFPLVESKKTPTFAPQFGKRIDDSLAQQVEHNTFNVGVLGSNPRRITEKSHSKNYLWLFFCMMLIGENKHRV